MVKLKKCHGKVSELNRQISVGSLYNAKTYNQIIVTDVVIFERKFKSCTKLNLSLGKNMKQRCHVD